MRHKNKIAIIAIALIIVVLTLYISNFSTQFTADIPELEMPTVTSNKEIIGTDLKGDETEIKVVEQKGVTMYIDPLTTNIILKDKNDNILAQTLPGFEDDDNKQSETLSPIMVTYKLNSYSTPVKMYGYDDSILRGNYTIDLLDDGVKVVYTLGTSNITDQMIPSYIEKDFYDEHMDPVLTQDQKDLLHIYYSYSESANAFAKLGKINPNKITEVYNLIYTVSGFTEEDLEAVNEKFDIKEEKVAEPVGFTIPVIYKLDKDGNLNVQIPLNEVLVGGVNQLISIDLLPGLMQTQKGHFLVPDGSGAIIDTTVPKTTKVYSKPFTNLDREIVGNQVDQVTNNLTLPVFANDNIIAFIDSGAEVSDLNVELIGKSKLIYPSINMQYSSFYSFSEEAANQGINLTSQQTDGMYNITYQINSDDQSFYDYVKTTQQYYMNKFGLDKTAVDPKLYLYTLGAFDYTDYLAGIPYTALDTLTTAEDIEAMLGNLSNIPNIQVIYDGWNGNGISSSILDTDAAKQNGDVQQLVEDYPNVTLATNLVRISSKFSNGFNMNVDGTYGVDGKVVENFNILNSSFKKDLDTASYYYLAPQYLQSAIDKYIANYDFNPSIFIKDLGGLGYASFDSDNPVLPLEAEQIISGAISSFKQAGFEIGMNNPVLTRGFMADYIVGLPATNSGDTIFDYSVPFTQLVYSGLVNTSNTSINLSRSGNIQLEVLHAFETQSSIMFTVSGENSSALKDTDYDKYYSSNFTYWIDMINQINNEYQKFLKEIDNSQIESVQLVKDGVDIVTYENGKQIVFNFTDVDVDVDGMTVKPLSYKLMEVQ